MMMTVAEFRKNMREAFNAVERGELVTIERFGTTFVLTTSKVWNDKMTDAQKNGVTSLITDDVSSPVRPDVTPIKDPVVFDESAEAGTEMAQEQMNAIKNLEVDKAKNALYGSTPEKPNEFAEAIKAGKYRCCAQRTPCKHWQWSVEREEWINQLTGEVKGAENEV